MIRKLCYILDKRQKISFILLCVIIMGSSFTELLGVALITPIVTVITDATIITTDKKYIIFSNIFDVHTQRDFVLALISVVIFVYFIKNIYIVLQNYVQYRYVYNNQRKISTRLMEHYIRKDYLYHCATNVAEIQRNITTDVRAVFDSLLNIFYVLNESLVCIMLIIYLLTQDWVSTILMALILSGFLFIFGYLFRKYAVRLGQKTRVVEAEQQKWILQAFAGIKAIKVTENEKYFTDNYKKAAIKSSELARKKAFITMIPKPVMEVVCVDGLLLIIGLRIYNGNDLKTFIPVLSSFAVAAFRMLPSFNRISQYYGTVMYGKASVDSVFNDIVEYRNDISQNFLFTQENQNDDLDLSSGIQLENISFAYPNNDPVFENINMKIPYKKSVALIGSSGAGKSTLADVILGILPPTNGKIMLGNKNALDNLYFWHKKIGYIPQTIYLMDDSIKRNIAFGESDNDINIEKLWKVIKDAQLYDFITSLQDGIETIVGDQGVRLSGGQRQRIGIARALYSEPEFLVLDEATSALDNETESSVMETIDGLQGHQTMLVIAHRLSTISNCDLIYEVCNKNIILRNHNEIFQ